MACPPHKIRWAIFLGLACLALAVRLPRLGDRPLHTDEAVNAYIVGQVLAGEHFQYDPKDRHGPALCALTTPLARLSGARDFADLTETELRLVPVMVGAVTIIGFGFLAGRIGFLAALLAGVLFAFAPLPVYYSRYFIHETLFVAATFGLLLCIWRFISPGAVTVGVTNQPPESGPQPRAARRTHIAWRLGVLAGLCSGVMLASKETALLHFAVLGAAALAATLHLYAPKKVPAPAYHWLTFIITVGTASITFLLLIIALYSWGGTHWQGLSDLAQSLPRLAMRASGEGHEKGAWYYPGLLVDGWSGGVVLVLALIGVFGVVWREWTKAPYAPVLPLEQPVPPPRRSFWLIESDDADGRRRNDVGQQFLLVYSVVICSFYIAIPYKTPWLALNLWLPIALLAGSGAASLWRGASTPRVRGMLAAGVAVLVMLIARDTRLRVFAGPIDEKNPYAYAHTGEDLLQLPVRVTELAKSHPTKELRVAVIAADPWPLPWYLRKFSRVGFWQPGQDPGPADVYITSPVAAEQLAARLEGRRPEYFGVRPEVLVMLWPPPAARHE